MPTLRRHRTRHISAQDAWAGLNLSDSVDDTDDRHNRSDVPSIVYFVRHLGYIKIGFSASLARRLDELGVPDSPLMAFAFGGRADETATHRRFAHLRVEGPGLGREHFAAGPDLVAHINELRADYGRPPIERIP